MDDHPSPNIVGVVMSATVLSLVAVRERRKDLETVRARQRADAETGARRPQDWAGAIEAARRALAKEMSTNPLTEGLFV